MSTAFRCVFRARPAKALPRAGKGKGRPPCALRAGLGPSAAWRAHRAKALTSRGRKAGAPAGGAGAFCGVARAPGGSFDFTRPESRPPLRAGCACLRFILPPSLSVQKAKGKGGRLQGAPLPPGGPGTERHAARAGHEEGGKEGGGGPSKAARP